MTEEYGKKENNSISKGHELQTDVAFQEEIYFL